MSELHNKHPKDDELAREFLASVYNPQNYNDIDIKSITKVMNAQDELIKKLRDKQNLSEGIIFKESTPTNKTDIKFTNEIKKELKKTKPIISKLMLKKIVYFALCVIMAYASFVVFESPIDIIMPMGWIGLAIFIFFRKQKIGLDE